MILLILCGCNKSTSVIYPSPPPEETLYDTRILDNEEEWGTLNVHDPSIIKDGEYYYIFSTDVKVGGTPRAGIQVRRSKDLIDWEWVGYALDGVPKDAEEWTGATNLWAPDVAKMGDTYYLYYAASQFGKNRSFIGVATSNSINGPWIDQGEVFKTDIGAENNAIDPAIVFDKDSNPWMVYGSFWGGIYINRLNPQNGKLLEYGPGKLIARRSYVVSGAIEGPYIIYNKNQKKYYLFVSYDSLSSNYNVRVARSDNIDGPYVDYGGNKMTDITPSLADTIGTKILCSYKFKNSDGWIAPGHNSVLVDGDDYFIVHHARGSKDPNWPYLHVRRILWSPDGWPMVSPERYAGEQIQAINKSLMPGTWEYMNLSVNRNGTFSCANTQVTSQEIKLLANGKINADNDKSYWEYIADNTYKLYLYDKESDAEKFSVDTIKVIPAWDWENWCSTLVFTGLDQHGNTVWGKKVSNDVK